MLSMDFPPNEALAVEYVGLATSSQVAEMQKDVLRRALAELLPAAGEMLDVGESGERQFNSGIYVRCLACDLKKESGNFSIRVQEDDRLRLVSNLSRSQFKIQISHPDHTSQTWNIEVGKREVAWYPMLKADLLPSGGRISPANFVVQTCVKGLNCPTTRLYATRDSCTTQIQQWNGRRVELSVISGQQHKSTFIMAEKIPFQNEVKANSSVRVSLLSRSSSLSIKTSAKALKNGSIGDPVTIELQASSGFPVKHKIVEAVVTGEGEVEVVR